MIITTMVGTNIYSNALPIETILNGKSYSYTIRKIQQLPAIALGITEKCVIGGYDMNF